MKLKLTVTYMNGLIISRFIECMWFVDGVIHCIVEPLADDPVIGSERTFNMKAIASYSLMKVVTTK